jgi:hypothetical protein
MVKRDSALAAASVVERPRALTNRGNAEEGKQHATECQSRTY